MSRPVSRSLPILLAAAFFFAACSSSTGPVGVPPAAPPAPRAVAVDVDALLAHMTLEQKVGQITLIGFDGPVYDAGLREMIERYGVGGVIVSARNVDSPAQLAKLTNELQASALATSGVGLFIATDQEGGRVARLTTNKGFTEFPGAMALSAATRDVHAAAVNANRVAVAMAEEMKAVGINTDFAPDLDVNNNPANPVIGIRSFGSEPARVAALGVAFAEGLQSTGVIAFGKHFPGHGDTGVDSHLDLPVVSHPRARLDAVEFVPFKAAIAANVAGIMSAHVSFPTIDATPGLPGTLSAKVLTDLLRTDLHFDGLVVTDSLEMGALGRSGFPGPKAAARALSAGADVLLFNTGFKIHQAAIAQVAADVRSGAIPLARLDQAVRRALVAKARFGLIKPTPADPAQAGAICSSPAHRTLATDLAVASVTLLRDDTGWLPLPRNSIPVVITVPTAAKLVDALHGIEVRVAESPSDRDTAAAIKAIKANVGAPVIVTLAGGSRAQGEFARKLLATGAPVIFVAVREPYDLMQITAPTMLATYGANPVALQALAAVLTGEAKPAGHLPVDLPGLYPLGAGLESFRSR